MNLDIIKRKLWLPRNDIDAPSKGILCHWVREGDETSLESAPMVDVYRYNKLLELLPDHIVENLEKARLARDGLMPMLQAGGGNYEELLFPMIVDPGAVGTSAAEAKLLPTTKFGGNYLQPSGAPTRTIRLRSRGKHTTLTTAATLILRNRIAATDVITGAIIAQSGAITMDATAQTNTMWRVDEEFTVRTVGTTGTVFGMGDVDSAAAALTIANQQAKFMGVAGSTAPATQTWDMLNDQFFQFTAQWSLATAYSIQAHEYLLESLN